jgi:multicomponent K+:H+ antiporter subunit D
MKPVEGLLPHLAVLPIVVPLFAGALLMLLRGAAWTRVLASLSLASLLVMALALIAATASGASWTYMVGNWPAPFGIAMAVDRLAALMLTISALMGIACQLAALGRASGRFTALLQFQLAGLNGAFLTADLFNLFVFFEVLLAASYALLLDGQGAARLRAGLHYVTVNLLGSSLFLIAAAMFYGIAGTLNLADLDVRLDTLPATDIGLAQVAGLLLLVVFAIKAAALPLGLWLPGTYGAASAHVAALFAIMTKVGIYAILRVHGALFEPAPIAALPTGADVDPLAGLVLPWLLPAGLVTLLLGACGALAARDLRVLVAWLVVVSAGVLLAALGLGSTRATAAALYYLPHSTLAAGAAFLAVEFIARGRAGSNPPAAEHYLVNGSARVRGAPWIGACFFAAALVIAGLPPGSGFIAKVLLLDAAAGTPAQFWLWAGVLLASLLILVSLARAASAVFWRPEADRAGHADACTSGDAPPADAQAADAQAAIDGRGMRLACALLLVSGLAMVLFATSLFDFLLQAAATLGGP